MDFWWFRNINGKSKERNALVRDRRNRRDRRVWVNRRVESVDELKEVWNRRFRPRWVDWKSEKEWKDRIGGVLREWKRIKRGWRWWRWGPTKRRSCGESWEAWWERRNCGNGREKKDCLRLKTRNCWVWKGAENATQSGFPVSGRSHYRYSPISCSFRREGWEPKHPQQCLGLLPKSRKL